MQDFSINVNINKLSQNRNDVQILMNLQHNYEVLIVRF